MKFIADVVHDKIHKQIPAVAVKHFEQTETFNY